MTGQRIFLGVTSPHGSTARAAETMAEALRNGGAVVEMAGLDQAPRWKDFDTVILGAPIRFDRWHREARGFVLRHKAVLETMPVAAFFTCLTLSQESAAAQKAAGAYGDGIADLLPGLSGAAVGGFAGALDYARFGWPQRWLARGMLRMFGAQEGDFLDHQAIATWATQTHCGFEAQDDAQRVAAQVA